MAKTGIKIPTLEGLSSKSPDYVQKLDDSWENLSGLYRQQREKIKALFDSGTDDLKSSLKGIEGVVVESTIPLEDETIKERGEVVAEKYAEAVILRGKAKDRKGRVAVQRKIEDAIRKYRDAYDSKQRDLEAGLIEIERAQQDFGEAIYDLTNIVPLTKPDIFNFTLHYYIVRKDGVYETHVRREPFGSDKQPSVSYDEPFRNKYLTEANFSDPAFLNEFKEKSKEIKANAYFVTNPSKIPSPTALFYQASLKCMQDFLDEIDNKLKKAGGILSEQKRANPVQALLDSIKRGSEKFSFKDFLGFTCRD